MQLLSHTTLSAEDASPRRAILFLHGIYGAGRNWASVARRLVRARPEWSAVLVDLREHGGSSGFTPPHTLEAAAADLARLATSLSVPVDAVLGHSFGGKVALVYARAHARGLGQVWVVDSTPEAGEPRGSAWGMLGVLRRVPGPFEERSEAIAALEVQGVAGPVAQWLSTNLESRDGKLVWRLDLEAMEALLRDFFRTDLWPVVEDPPGELRLHFVKAEESSVLSEVACARIEAAGRTNGRVFLHRVEGGHWLNADNPDALQELLVRQLRGGRGSQPP